MVKEEHLLYLVPIVSRRSQWLSPYKKQARHL